MIGLFLTLFIFKSTWLLFSCKKYLIYKTYPHFNLYSTIYLELQCVLMCSENLEGLESDPSFFLHSKSINTEAIRVLSSPPFLHHFGGRGVNVDYFPLHHVHPSLQLFIFCLLTTNKLLCLAGLAESFCTLKSKQICDKVLSCCDIVKILSNKYFILESCCVWERESVYSYLGKSHHQK